MDFLKRPGREKTEHAVEKTRRAWFGRVGELFRRSHLDDRLWEELEELLISADVGVGPTDNLLGRIREHVRLGSVADADGALGLLKQEMVAILEVDGPGGRPHDRMHVERTPLVLLMVGVNGVGKTTGIAKLAHLYKQEGRQVVLGAADTFRAAAIEQLQAWGSRLGVDVIAHQPDADPGAVAFDALQAATTRGADVVIIDTAGRFHTKVNLMKELEKIRRVLTRQGGGDSQRVLLTLDATTGQNGLFQARSFVEAVDCDGVYLAKLDGTAKGGMVLSIADELRLPVLFIGTGEQPEDIAVFDAREFVDALFDDDSDHGGSAGS